MLNATDSHCELIAIRPGTSGHSRGRTGAGPVQS